MEYVVIYKKDEYNYGAYIRNLPGCAVIGATLEEVWTLIAKLVIRI